MEKVNDEPDEHVMSAKMLKVDFECLKCFTQAEAPPEVEKMREKCGIAFYGFGDASGKGFVFALEIEGVTYSQYGQ